MWLTPVSRELRAIDAIEEGSQSEHDEATNDGQHVPDLVPVLFHLKTYDEKYTLHQVNVVMGLT